MSEEVVTNTYRRVLLKLSGEVLMGEANFGIETHTLSRIANELHDIVQLGVQIGLVIGGGNIYRGAGLTAKGINKLHG